MFEKEAREKWCPMSPAISNCKGSGCMMWNWDTPENIEIVPIYDEKEKTLEELLETDSHKSKPKYGWIARNDGFSGWKRRISDSERHGSCGLANVNVYVERE